MKKIKVSRMHILNERWLLGNPIVEVDIYGKGGYKNIINQLSSAGYDIITIPEYNRKIVNYANKKGITVEDEMDYLPIYLKNKLKKRFEDYGAINLGVFFQNEDSRLAEKIIKNISKYCRFLSVPDYPRMRRLSDSILRTEGLKINLENTIDKMKKKCDIIIDIGTLEIII